MTLIPATWPGNQTRAKRCKRESIASNQSAVLDKLLELVGKGDAHVQIAADFARAVVEDCPNAAHPGIHHIAACGANGKFDGNTERDFQHLVRGFNGLSLEPYTIKLRLQVLSCYFGKFWFHGGLNFDPKSFPSTPAPSSISEIRNVTKPRWRKTRILRQSKQASCYPTRSLVLCTVWVNPRPGLCQNSLNHHKS